ncbi:hypothetical protein E3N88_19337 [Mikania micrantha]|uniref:Uncharacterized protein n=1 Tax=Mikania micrantha TaxID=192012 RepID=A0A5N6NMW9_9ASTR|nr:hypothetical protein E3N88_19337 [Mikania micrantha]
MRQFAGETSRHVPPPPATVNHPIIQWVARRQNGRNLLRVRLTGLKIWRLIQPCGVAGEALKKKKKRRDGKRTILPSHVT